MSNKTKLLFKTNISIVWNEVLLYLYQRTSHDSRLTTADSVFGRDHYFSFKPNQLRYV